MQPLSALDGILRSAARQAASPSTESAGPPTRADELLARFAAQGEADPTRRAAARTLKALAGLDLTPPPPSGGLAFSLGRGSPRPPAAALADRGLDGTPAPPSSRSSEAVLASDSPRGRSRGPALWLALLAIALICAVGAGLAMTLRPDLLAAFAPSAPAPPR